MKQIVFQRKDWLELCSYLSQRNDVETAAYAVFKISSHEGALKLLVTKVLVPNEKDYHCRTSIRVAFKAEFTERVFQFCEGSNGHLLDIHTHPFSEYPDFSAIDDTEAGRTKVPYMAQYLPNMRIAFIVLGKTMVKGKARYWDIENSKLADIDRIAIV